MMSENRVYPYLLLVSSHDMVSNISNKKSSITKQHLKLYEDYFIKNKITYPILESNKIFR